jgi:cytochrome c-type biogenesis protein
MIDVPSIGLVYAAGLVVSLSPCVLPALPIMASGAVAQNRLAPLAAAFGLVLAFVSVGVFLQTVGFALGITADGVQKAGGVVLLLAAAVLLIEPLQFFLQRFLSPLSGRAGNAVHQQSGRSLLSWIVIGFLLGAVWSPCTGPAWPRLFAISSQQDTMLLGMALLADHFWHRHRYPITDFGVWLARAGSTFSQDGQRIWRQKDQDHFWFVIIAYWRADGDRWIYSGAGLFN